MENKFIYNFVRNVNKQHPKTVAQNILNEVEEGNMNVLGAYAAIKRIETIFKYTVGDEAKDNGKRFKENTLSEVRKYDKDGISSTIYGANFTAAAVHTWYDFSNTNDPIWYNLDEIEKKVKKLKKEREDFLKTIPLYEEGKLTRAYRTEIIHTLPTLEWVDCGEEYDIKAPNKNQREGVKVSIR